MRAKREIIIIIIIRPPPAWTVTKLFLVAGVSPLLLLLPAPLSFFTLGQGARSLCTMVSAQLPLLTPLKFDPLTNRLTMPRISI